MAIKRKLVRLLWRPSAMSATRNFHTTGAKLRRGWTIPTVGHRMRELFGSRRSIPPPIQQNEPPSEEQTKMQRVEHKSLVKAQIKSSIKARLMNERLAYYAKLPKNEEERLQQRIQRAEKSIAVKRLELRKYTVQESGNFFQEHDPEVLTAEQMHYLKKMGQRYKNYCPVGKRGVYGGTVENMHMHWKRHQTVRVDCHSFSMEETKKMAEELARLSGGIVVDILWDKTIIMYRGRNYEQPRKLIPEGTLNKRNAFRKALIEQSINARLRFIEGVKKNLQQLKDQREYQEQKKAQSSLPVKKTRPLFTDVGQTFDFEDDSDPCSNTDDEGDGAAEALSGEEDQGSLLKSEASKDFDNLKTKRRLWNHRRFFVHQLTKATGNVRLSRRWRGQRRH